ncbi:hypothetical protein N311_02982, partial [Apaloderma vittatum]
QATNDLSSSRKIFTSPLRQHRGDFQKLLSPLGVVMPLQG